MFYYQQGLTRSSYIEPLNRKYEFERYQMKKNIYNDKGQERLSRSSSIDEAIELNENEYDGPINQDINYLLNENKMIIDHEQAFQLKSSGRIIRNIDQAPPKEKRMWITYAQTCRVKQFLLVRSII